jgi:hypothetical protein
VACPADREGPAAGHGLRDLLRDRARSGEGLPYFSMRRKGTQNPMNPPTAIISSFTGFLS